MWSFLGVFIFVIAGLILLGHPSVQRFLHGAMMLSVLLIVAGILSLMIWLSLFSPS